jgi:hypothetical protein
VQIKPVIFNLPRCTSAELFISCFCSYAALPALANCNGYPAKTNISRLHPPTLSALCTAPTAREVRVVKPLYSFVWDAARAPMAFPVSRAKLPRSFLRFSAPPTRFIPRDPRLQAVSSREIGTCRRASAVTRWATGFRTRCDEHGIRGDGEYCGNNDAHFDRINVFYHHEALDGKYVPRAGLFDLEPGMIGAVARSRRSVSSPARATP